MNRERVPFHITIALLLIKDDKVLLMKRRNTGYMDEMYGFISGHLEKNESLSSAIIRESSEEVGIVIKKEDLKFVCAIRRGDNSNYFNYFFATDKFEGNPSIKEPDKCDELIWCDIKNLPENIIAAEKRAIYNYQNNIYLDEYNF